MKCNYGEIGSDPNGVYMKCVKECGCNDKASSGSLMGWLLVLGVLTLLCGTMWVLHLSMGF